MRYQNTVELKIELEFIEPQIWRRVSVPDNYSLADLHHIIQTVMGWHDCHLHCFEVNGGKYTLSSQSPEMDMEDESKVRLTDLVKAGTKQFLYEYDFGDDWRHWVTIEKVAPIDPDSIRPVCLDGTRACPPEDCGSIPGYEDLVDAFREDSPDEDQEALLEWLESMEPGWNPDVFDRGKVNQVLQG
ncbi:plasmid pRiA4b ORF-3 family protein [Pontiellaceae bacterium B12227]|nr:plasmid pRiA4b ORF-3 family protein [Pontiellaceae bacterium B12227]